MARPIEHLDTSRPVVEADARLQALLAAPPAGHTEALQPDAWYEQVFDLLACTHPENCTCTPLEAS